MIITKQKGVLPNFIIIGGMKCGTTSLHQYLNYHPEIFMSREKELKFFVEDKNWNKGIEWYKSHFTGVTQICGESSPAYTKYPINQGVAERIHRLIPNVKLIYILRDPVERIISHYLHRYIAGTENRHINIALANLEDNHYVYRSMYYFQLEQYLKYFPESNILILTLEDLSTNTQQNLDKIFNFLGVDRDCYSLGSFKKIHQYSDKRRKTKLGNYIAKLPIIKQIGHLPSREKWYLEKIIYFPFSHRVEKPELDEDIRTKLIDLLSKDIEKLRKYTGNNFSSWCV